MFIAMNRFRVKKGSEDAFEKVWLGRDSYLDSVLGFLEFHLLKGPEAEDHTLYSSHTVWQSKQAFEAWTKSEEFRASHARAGNQTTGPLPSLERRRPRERPRSSCSGLIGSLDANTKAPHYCALTHEVSEARRPGLDARSRSHPSIA